MDIKYLGSNKMDTDHKIGWNNGWFHIAGL